MNAIYDPDYLTAWFERDAALLAKLESVPAETRQAMRRRLTRRVMDTLRRDTDAQGAAMVVFEDTSAEAWIPDDEDRAAYGYGIVRFCEKALRYA
jgi:hypothetical protein